VDDRLPGSRPAPRSGISGRFSGLFCVTEDHGWSGSHPRATQRRLNLLGSH
jgi:hypothetical protein